MEGVPDAQVLPPAVAALVASFGVDVDSFAAAFAAETAKADYVPAAWKDAVAAALATVRAKVSDPAVVLAAIVGAWGELKSGHPGFDPDAGSLA